MNDIPLIRIASEKNRSAIRLAERAHRGETRKGDPDVPYITHPFFVADLLAGAGADRNLVCAGLLHDVVEDTSVTIEQIREEFGDTVSRLVWAVTKGSELKGLRLEEFADIIHRRLVDEDIDGSRETCALKIADLLANISDLVWDAERKGVSTFAETFHTPARAPRKIRHYLRLVELLATELDGGSYARLSEAARIRATELNALLERFESEH